MSVKTALLGSIVASVLALPAFAEGDLNIYAWSDSIDPALITAFEAETGIKVSIGSHASNED